MAIREILKLGDPRVFQVCTPIDPEEVAALGSIVEDLRDTLLEFRRLFGAGRAIAAPQIGVMKSLVYADIDKPLVLVNPRIENGSPEMIELWDDCMSFPELLVKVRRHASCDVTFQDLKGARQVINASGSLSELFQHECDHLNGILAVARAIDGRSFSLRSSFAGKVGA